VRHLLFVALLACTLAVAGCRSGDGSVNLEEFRVANAPYYYVGPSFDGLHVTHILRYQAGEADVLYGTCKPPSGEGGCGLPLELQHRLCHGIVTVSISGERDRARRAAKALRPLSKGARARPKRPFVVFDQGVSC
jgi:hypothetical protein